MRVHAWSLLCIGAICLSRPLMAEGQEISTAAMSAWASLRDAHGKDVGHADLTWSPQGVEVVLKVNGLPPGLHGVHLHEVGKCMPPDFLSAGAHVNPFGKAHGHKNPKGAHLGDLPNVVVKADGTGGYRHLLNGAALRGGAHPIRDADNAALVIHANADDEKTDPAGNSGARIACGMLLSE